MSKNIILECVLFAAVTFFTEQLASNGRGIHIQIHRLMEGTYEVLVCSGVIHICLDIQKLIGGDTQTHRQHGDRISLLLFFKNKESRLIRRKSPFMGPTIHTHARGLCMHHPVIQPAT
jgi:hypothetical protein